MIYLYIALAFVRRSYAEISSEGKYAIGGLLDHAGALSAIVSPTTNSYRRLIPGYEAPVYLAWSKSNRSAVVRVPTYYKGVEHAKRIEYRAPDPTCNPYLAFSAILMAALDGIKKKIDPGAPVVDENIFHMGAEKRKEPSKRVIHPRRVAEIPAPGHSNEPNYRPNLAMNTPCCASIAPVPRSAC